MTEHEISKNMKTQKVFKIKPFLDMKNREQSYRGSKFEKCGGQATNVRDKRDGIFLIKEVDDV